MENSRYANSSIPYYGSWLETPQEYNRNTSIVWIVHSGTSSVGGYFASNTSIYSARPTIDVPKSKISY